MSKNKIYRISNNIFWFINKWLERNIIYTRYRRVLLFFSLKLFEQLSAAWGRFHDAPDRNINPARNLSSAQTTSTHSKLNMTPHATAGSALTYAPRTVAMRKEAHELRRTLKPLLEKKRRARINESLDQLKVLILPLTGKDVSSLHIINTLFWIVCMKCSCILRLFLPLPVFLFRIAVTLNWRKLIFWRWPSDSWLIFNPLRLKVSILRICFQFDLILWSSDVK